MIDETDVQILNILQTDGRISNAELSRKLEMAPSGVLERVKRLERKGIIRGYEVLLDPVALGLNITVFIHLKTSDSVGSTVVGEQVRGLRAILEVHWIAGDFNYLIKARVNNTDGLKSLMKNLGQIPGVLDSKTSLVFDTLKEQHTVTTEFATTKQAARKQNKA
jgi:Lrp/AsnC family leucine-responsive transcriptional regulator